MLKYISIAALSLATFSYMGCGASTDQEPKQTVQSLAYSSITAEQAYTIINEEDPANYILLDVRTPEEFAAGHIKGAINIPVQELSDRLEEIPQNPDLKKIIYCRSGNRSQTATQILAHAGYANLFNMLGGIKSWVKKGYTIEQ